MLPQVGATQVARLRHRRLVTVAPETPVSEVVRAMVEAHRGAAVVVDGDRRVLGIFTDGDVLLKGVKQSFEWRDRPVGDVMTPKPVTAGGDEEIAAAVRRMRHGRFHHLPVVDSKGRVTGIISVRDVLAYIVDSFPQEFMNLPPEPSLEATERWGG